MKALRLGLPKAIVGTLAYLSCYLFHQRLATTKQSGSACCIIVPHFPPPGRHRQQYTDTPHPLCASLCTHRCAQVSHVCCTVSGSCVGTVDTAVSQPSFVASTLTVRAKFRLQMQVGAEKKCQPNSL